MKEASTTQFEAAQAVDSANALRVLLAEDTPISAEAMRAMAEHLAVDIDIAPNGLKAIEMVEAARSEGRPYSLMLVDVMMPILDGVETTKRLRQRGYDPESLPIIAVTAATSFDEIRSYRACGMQAFLAKPVALADLRATFEAWGHKGCRNEEVKRIHMIEPALLKALGQQFRDRNERTLNLIEDVLAADDFSEATIAEIRHLLHQIAGTATTFGDAKLSKAARAHENALIAAQMDKGELRQCLEQAANSLKERIDP
ncbi:MAG: response regulator [Pseudomonadota bacterium]